MDDELKAWLLSKTETIDVEAAALYEETIGIGIVTGSCQLAIGGIVTICCLAVAVYLIRKAFRLNDFDASPPLGLAGMIAGCFALMASIPAVCGAYTLLCIWIAPRLYVISQLT